MTTTKNLLALLLTMTFVLSIGCTSKKTEGDKAADEQTQTAAEGGEEFDEFSDEFSDEEGLESGEEAVAENSGDDGMDEFSDDFSDEFSDDEEPADEVIAEGDTSEVTDGAAEEVTEEVATDEGYSDFGDEAVADLGDDEGATSEYAATDEYAGGVEEPDTAPIDESTGTEEEPFQSAYTEPVDEPVQTWIPLKKMATQPFTKRGVLVNAIYISRQGDDINSISQKIYGNDRTQDLLSVNPWLEGEITVGEKVYYNSPQRPNDNEKFMVFYEDIGLAPEIYNSKAGDNIMTIASQLLGDTKSWKEVWATNLEVDSKGDLEEGVQLRYWTGADVKAPMMAQNDMQSPAQQDDMPSDLPPPTAEMPPAMSGDGSMDVANNDIPPPPPPMPESNNDIPPPPPVVAAVEPPPPPPPTRPKPRMMNKRNQATPPTIAEDNPDELMIMGAAAILILGGLALFIARRKKKGQAIDFNTTTHTQID